MSTWQRIVVVSGLVTISSLLLVYGLLLLNWAQRAEEFYNYCLANNLPNLSDFCAPKPIPYDPIPLHTTLTNIFIARIVGVLLTAAGCVVVILALTKAALVMKHQSSIERFAFLLGCLTIGAGILLGVRAPLTAILVAPPSIEACVSGVRVACPPELVTLPYGFGQAPIVPLVTFLVGGAVVSVAGTRPVSRLMLMISSALSAGILITLQTMGFPDGYGSGQVMFAKGWPLGWFTYPMSSLPVTWAWPISYVIMTGFIADWAFWSLIAGGVIYLSLRGVPLLRTK